MFRSVARSLCNMMELILFNLTFTCITAIAFNLFVIDLNDSLSYEIIVALADLFFVLNLTLAHFYLSEWITSDLLEIGNIFYNGAWYRLPTMQQKLLVLPIQRAGRPLHLEGLGLFDCSLAVFVSVIY